MTNYILDDDGYFLGTVDNDLATHTKIDVAIPEYTDTQLCKWDGSQWLVEDSQTLIDAKAEYDAQEYARNREAEYPSIQECVHAILDNTLDVLQAKRASVKLKYPKGG